MGYTIKVSIFIVFFNIINIVISSILILCLFSYDIRCNFVHANRQICLNMERREQSKDINDAHAAVLFEYIRGTSPTTSSIATAHYAIGYIIKGNCRVASGDKTFKVPENCLYVLERGRHIIKNITNPNGVFEQVIMHLEANRLENAKSGDVEEDRLEHVVMSAVAENLSLEELAERCFVSVSTFKRRFRRRFSLPPHRWFTLRRLDLAYRIILATDLPIAEIAKMCGFTNPSHFISAFKRQFDITPANLRRKGVGKCGEQLLGE